MKKSIVFIVFLMFLTMAVFPSGESAGATVTLTDWEDVSAGLSEGTSGYIDFDNIASPIDWLTSTGWSKSGSKSFYMFQQSSTGHNPRGWWNLTDNISYMSEISFWLNLLTISTPQSYEFSFYNGTNLALKLRLEGDDLDFYDVSTGWTEIDSNVKGINQIVIQHNGTNMMYYQTYNVAGVLQFSVEGASASTDTWTSFNKIYFARGISGGGQEKFYIDDLEIKAEEQISTDECAYKYMTERYSYIGNINSYCDRQSNKATIETRYNVPTTQNITCIDLAVSSSQYEDDAVKSHYSLTLNGVSVFGSPDCFIEYSYYYILRWIIDVELSNDIVIMEFTHSQKTSYGRYWQVVTGCNSNTDLDNDGEVHYKESNTADGSYNGQTWAWDLAYQMYYEDIQFPDDEDYYDNDYISVINETHYCGEPVWLTYLLTTMASDTYVRIWNDDTSVEIDDVMFPYKCPTTGETVGFVAEVKANYTAKLYRNSVELDNCSFFVEDFRNPTNYVYTMPNPCFEGEPYLVKFAYDNADSYDGAIFLSSSPDYRNYYDVYYILDGESGSYTQIQNAPCTLYYILAVNKNGTYYVVNNGIHQHTVKSKSLQNYFTLGATHVTLKDGEGVQSISGETTHIGGNCKIYDNGKLVYTITETPFNEFYTITTAGNHKVEMRLVTNETIVLHTQNYTVSGEEDAPLPEEDIGEVIRNYIKQEWGELGLLVFAFGIIIGLMLIPLYVQLKASQTKTDIEIPWMVYILFAIIGVVVDVYLGFLPVYVILLMCIGGIACAVAMYYNRN